MTFLHHTGLFSLTRPGVFIVAHVAYFGLLWPLLFLHWGSSLSPRIRSLGLPILLTALVFMVLSLNSESRQLMPGIGMLVLLLAEPLSKVEIRKAWFIVLVFILIGYSKVWLHVGEWDAMKGLEVPGATHHLAAIGPWMTRIQWLYQLPVVFILLFVTTQAGLAERMNRNRRVRLRWHLTGGRC